MAIGALIGALFALLGAGESAELEGIWHVLIHYQDANAHDPEQWRWDDRVWVIERNGEELSWTEYPLAVFEDESGRFESLGTNTASRVPGRWEPNPAQLTQIREAIEINPRGKKTKALAAVEGGWRSAPSSENWSILGAAHPEFAQLVGGESRLGTRYTVESVDPETGALRGRFDRDGSRIGVFRMLRSGASELRGTQSGRLFRAWSKAWGQSLTLGGGRELDAADRDAARAAIRDSIERDMRGRKLDPRNFGDAIDGLVGEIERRILDEGSSWAEVGDLLEEGDLP